MAELVQRDLHAARRSLTLRIELSAALVEAYRLQDRAFIFLRLAQGALSNDMPELAAVYAASSARLSERASALARGHQPTQED